MQFVAVLFLLRLASTLVNQSCCQVLLKSQLLFSVTVICLGMLKCATQFPGCSCLRGWEIQEQLQWISSYYAPFSFSVLGLKKHGDYGKSSWMIILDLKIGWKFLKEQLLSLVLLVYCTQLLRKNWRNLRWCLIRNIISSNSITAANLFVPCQSTCWKTAWSFINIEGLMILQLSH